MRDPITSKSHGKKKKNSNRTKLYFFFFFLCMHFAIVAVISLCAAITSFFGGILKLYIIRGFFFFALNYIVCICGQKWTFERLYNVNIIISIRGNKRPLDK